jgi:hypothetical protein
MEEGWEPGEVSGSYLSAWKKDGQSLTIAVAMLNQTSSILSISCTNCMR